MDSNTFAILVLALATVIVCVIIWQIFGVARVRARAAAMANQQERASQLHHRQRQLDQRLTSLADDVNELGRRLAELEPPTQP